MATSRAQRASSHRVRTVDGPTGRVVVVGAGLAGLATAMHLAGAGREVVLLERSRVPGGRAGLHSASTDAGTYRFDTGPTVLTMPSLLQAPFAALGENLDDWLTLRPVDPAYRVRFADGDALTVHADPDVMAAEIARLCGPREAAGYRAFTELVTRMYALEVDGFIDRNIDSPLDMLTPDLLRLVGLGGLRRLDRLVGSYLHDDRLRRVFSFQALYAGLSPFEAWGIYAVISYMDAVNGVFFPVGGMHAVPRAMAAAAARHGVRIEYGRQVTGLERVGDRVTAVFSCAVPDPADVLAGRSEASGDEERTECDVVVLTPDLPVALRDLLGGDAPDAPASLRRRTRRAWRQRWSPSCTVWLAGSAHDAPEDAHHTVHLGRAWRETFDDLAAGRFMRDPSFLVTRPTVSDPGLAPPGRHCYYVLFPVPHLDHHGRAAGLDLAPGSAARERFVEHMHGHLAARGYDLDPRTLDVDDLTTPHGWAAQGMAAGTPFAGAHVLRQTGPFRPRNRWGANVVLAGSGTTPGVGVPMVLVSGRLAAERVTG